MATTPMTSVAARAESAELRDRRDGPGTKDPSTAGPGLVAHHAASPVRSCRVQRSVLVPEPPGTGTRRRSSASAGWSRPLYRQSAHASATCAVRCAGPAPGRPAREAVRRLLGDVAADQVRRGASCRPRRLSIRELRCDRVSSDLEHARLRLNRTIWPVRLGKGPARPARRAGSRVRDEDHAVVADRRPPERSLPRPIVSRAPAAGRQAHDRPAARVHRRTRPVLGDVQAAVRAERQAGDPREAPGEDRRLSAGHPRARSSAIRRVGDVQSDVGAGPPPAPHRPPGETPPTDTPPSRSSRSELPAASATQRCIPSMATPRIASAASAVGVVRPSSNALRPARISMLPGRA